MGGQPTGPSGSMWFCPGSCRWIFASVGRLQHASPTRRQMTSVEVQRSAWRSMLHRSSLGLLRMQQQAEDGGCHHDATGDDRERVEDGGLAGVRGDDVVELLAVGAC